ncbi:hypothetical protein Poly41_22450 [Novipirellula artificiosorum]|uniref:Uncharacterized protein n=1 Tax=Novipirellula artificiosorum TaxID=2528016 RepID=A0A5C6DVF4_9BACT|nr:hypothetical protein Poly41_22450 [Novipirellula artificiosorum]
MEHRNDFWSGFCNPFFDKSLVSSFWYVPVSPFIIQIDLTFSIVPVMPVMLIADLERGESTLG